MRKLAAFEAFGIDAVPWSVPDIGVTKTRAGRRVRFARRPKKSDLDRGRASLGDWQRFVADASHELRSPLGALRGQIEVALRRARTADEYRAVLESCLEEVGRLGRLAESLLELVRAGATYDI